jgi:hypothetical protein
MGESHKFNQATGPQGDDPDDHRDSIIRFVDVDEYEWIN